MSTHAAKNTNIIIETLKSIAICLVVVGHSLPTKLIEENVHSVIVVRNIIYSFHMPLFMFISGFLFVKYSLSNTDKYHNEISFIISKFKLLIIPYIALQLLGFLLKGFVNDYSYGHYEFSLIYYLNGLVNPADSSVPMYWFLLTLFIIFLFHPIWKIIFKSNKIICIII